LNPIGRKGLDYFDEEALVAFMKKFEEENA